LIEAGPIVARLRRFEDSDRAFTRRYVYATDPTSFTAAAAVRATLQIPAACAVLNLDLAEWRSIMAREPPQTGE